MKSLLGEEEYLEYIKSFDSKRYQGLRANGIKIEPKRLKRTGAMGDWKIFPGFPMDSTMGTI